MWIRLDRLRWYGVGLALLLGCVSVTSVAQTYPTRPIRLIVPFGTGGATDVLARMLAERLSSNMNQTVVVESRPGGNTLIGTEVVWSAPADGYTLLMVTQTHAANAALYPDLRWDPVRDFSAAGLFARSVPLLAIPSSLPAKNLAEFIAYAKANPGKLDYGHSGVGSPPHLAFELFKRVAAVEIQAIPYKGNAAVVTDLLSGRLSACLLAAVSTSAQAKAGKVRHLAIMDTKRSKAFPEVPSIAELGYPDAQSQSWFGVVVHAKTPREITKRLSDEIEKVTRAPDMAERLERAGAEAAPMTAEAMDALIRKEVVTWTRVVKEGGLKPE